MPLSTSNYLPQISPLIAGGKESSWSMLKATGLRWFTLTFPSTGHLSHDKAVTLEQATTARATSLLRQAVQQGVSHCETCGKMAPPWAKFCNSCYQQRSWYWDFDD